MPPTRTGRRSNLTLCLCSVLLLVLSGCAAVGPRSVRAGRVAYAEAINQTENEQILLSIVKGRYGETNTLLTVNAVAANIRFQANAGVDVGFGSPVPGENLATGGIAYEENPTITYAPVQGEEYVRRLLSPIPLADVALLVRSAEDSERMMAFLLDRANGLRNPDFVHTANPEEGKDFALFLKVLFHLRDVGVLEVLSNPHEDVVFEVWIDDPEQHYSEAVAELLSLLDLTAPDQSGDYVIPAFLSLNREKAWAIGMSTRSTMDLVDIMRASVDVPEEHQDAGLVRDYPPLGKLVRGIHISSSRTKPKDLSPAIRYRDYWFYIDETDQKTKSAFAAVRTLWSICTAGSTDLGKAPVLTIPVSN